jgi:hypothetical protein
MLQIGYRREDEKNEGRREEGERTERRKDGRKEERNIRREGRTINGFVLVGWKDLA